MTRYMLHILATACCLLTGTAARADWFAEAEGGVVFNTLNDVRIPGDSGTRISLTRDLSIDPAPYTRFRLGGTISGRHTILALYAPLRLTASGRLGRTIVFAGHSYPEGTQVRASYTFNSYRLTYRYSIVMTEDLEIAVGGTGKIRDAGIVIESPTYAEKTNVGFVPLVSFRLAYHVSPSWSLLLDGDALAASQGRAEDVLLAGTVAAGDHTHIWFGYRILEGGADNPEVYTFAVLHYLSLGLSISL